MFLTRMGEKASLSTRCNHQGVTAVSQSSCVPNPWCLSLIVPFLMSEYQSHWVSYSVSFRPIPVECQSHCVPFPMSNSPFVSQTPVISVPLYPFLISISAVVSHSQYQPHCVPPHWASVPLCPKPLVSQPRCVPFPMTISPFVSHSQLVSVPLCPNPIVSQPCCVPFQYQSHCVPFPKSFSPVVSHSQ